MRKQVINGAQFQLSCYLPEQAIPAQNQSQIIKFIRKHIQKPFWNDKEPPQGWVLVLDGQTICGFARIFPENGVVDWQIQHICAICGYLGGGELVLIRLDETSHNMEESTKTAVNMKENIEHYSNFFEVNDFIMMNEDHYFSFAETGLYALD